MLTPRVPSVQHLARTWHSDPVRVKRELVRLVLNTPTFSYNPFYRLLSDRFRLNVPFSQIEKAVQGIKRRSVRDNYLSIVKILEDEFSTVHSDFAPDISRRFYPVGRDIRVPFDLPLCYASSGILHLPWMIFWRSHPLTGERLSLFATMVAEMLAQDPDLEDAEFKIYDCSTYRGTSERVLKVIDMSQVPILSPARKSEMLATYTEGFRLAEAELASACPQPKKAKQKPTRDDHQGDMFDSPDQPQ